MTDRSNKPAATDRSATTQRTAPRPIPTREEFHRSFAGVIYDSDFDTTCDHSPIDMGSRIITTKKFDNHCKINDNIRKRRSTYGKKL